MNHTVRALVLITKQSLARVRELSTRLESASHRDAAPTIRALKAECDSLSGSLSKLARYYVDHLDAPEEKEPCAATNDPRLLKVAKRLVRAAEGGVCRRCGGVLPGEKPARREACSR